MGYALVTGASGGIGRQMAEEFAKHGHDVVLVARSEGKLARLSDDLRSRYGVDAVVLMEDLTDPDGPQRVHDATERAGIVVDWLVNDAGFGDQAAFLDADWNRQQAMVQLNVLALMQLTYLYGNDMRARGHGGILNLSSVAAFCAGPYMSVYYATKGFVLQFSEALALELRGTGVTVTALCPGPTATGFERAAAMHGSSMFSHAQSAESVARRGYLALMMGKPVALHSSLTYAMNVATRILPRMVVALGCGIVDGMPRER